MKSPKNIIIFCLTIITLFLLGNSLHTKQQLNEYVNMDIEHSLKRMNNSIVEARITLSPIAKNMPKKKLITFDEFKQITNNYYLLSRDLYSLKYRCAIVKNTLNKEYKTFKECTSFFKYSKESNKIFELEDSIYKEKNSTNLIPLDSTDTENFEVLYELYKKLSIKLQELHYSED